MVKFYTKSVTYLCDNFDKANPNEKPIQGSPIPLKRTCQVIISKMYRLAHTPKMMMNKIKNKAKGCKNRMKILIRRNHVYMNTLFLTQINMRKFKTCDIWYKHVAHKHMTSTNTGSPRLMRFQFVQISLQCGFRNLLKTRFEAGFPPILFLLKID